MKSTHSLAAILLSCVLSACTHGPAQCSYSSLWGNNGTAWRSGGRLSDYSYVGYRAGENALAEPSVVANLKTDFHAAGDGKTDDSGALLLAIQKSPPGVIFIPAGTYVISRQIKISRSDVVLRGEGKGRTVLYFPKSFTDMFGNVFNSDHTSQWSFDPGLIQFEGTDDLNRSTLLTSVVSDAKRGDTTLQVSDTSRIKVGQWIRLTESDPPPTSPHSGSLLSWLVGGMVDVGLELPGSQNVVRFPTRVRAIHSNRIDIERALPYDVRKEWKAEIHAGLPKMQEVGIESLSIRFPLTPYPGHFKENGFNAIWMTDVANCWIRDVQITNADFGIDLVNTHFCTVSAVTLDVSGNRASSSSLPIPKQVNGPEAWNGHHGINVGAGTDNLVTDFHIRTRFVHDISVEWYALNTVYSDGDGVDLNMDHHRAFNFSSLFTNLNLGEGNRAFRSGGSKTRGPHSASYSTFWHLRASKALTPPPPDFGPNLNFVDVPLRQIPSPLPNDWLVEDFAAGVCPKNLHLAMSRKRLGK